MPHPQLVHAGLPALCRALPTHGANHWLIGPAAFASDHRQFQLDELRIS
jgi:hypothetical protein